MEVKTLKDIQNMKLFGNSNFSHIINLSMDVIHNCSTTGQECKLDITDTPISPMAIDSDETPIIFAEDVKNEYQKILKLINEPKTALEYSYLLLGKSAKIGNEKCYLINKIINIDAKQNLGNRATSIDNALLNKEINAALNEGYDFISIAHTHPCIPLEESKNTIANYLSEDILKRENIRQPGLNLSLADFLNYEVLYRFFFYQPHIKTAFTVIMFNQELAIISKQNYELRRFINIFDEQGNLFPVAQTNVQKNI